MAVHVVTTSAAAKIRKAKIRIAKIGIVKIRIAKIRIVKIRIAVTMTRNNVDIKREDTKE